MKNRCGSKKNPYQNRQEAIEAGPTEGAIWIVSGSYYYWKECPSCRQVTLVHRLAKYCSNRCGRLQGADLHDQTVYSKSDLTIGQYNTFHHRVEAAYGRASRCFWGCESIQFEWANQTGKYGDIDDYIELCAKCHRNYDRGRRVKVETRDLSEQTSGTPRS